MANTTIIQNSIPVRYNPRVVVKPSAPHRVPHLPVDILYQIAQALPQPKSVFNLARANKETWDYLQPALYQCEVTYEARLVYYFGDQSPDTLRHHYRQYIKKPTDSDSDDDASENEAGEDICEIKEERFKQNSTTGGCEDRIELDERIFTAPLPENLLDTRRRMTALHWACARGESALPVALKAIRSALAHNLPSYINGVDLMERRYFKRPDYPHVIFGADLPPPLFLAVAHGNVAVCKALIEAGCNVNILQGQNMCESRSFEDAPQMAFKVHTSCLKGERGRNNLECICRWEEDFPSLYEYRALGCQTAGHVAVQYEQPEMLSMLLQNGLDMNLGLYPLIRDAVAEGNVDAIRILLDRDPSLIHSLSRRRDHTLMHIVPHMRQRAWKEDVRNGRLRDTVAYLVERGAAVEQAVRNNHTPMLEAFEYVSRSDELKLLEGPSLVIALHAAEVFVSMGAADMPEFDILSECISGTVDQLSTAAYDMGYDEELNYDWNILYREIRKGWGRVLKAIVERATRALSHDDSATNRKAFQDLFSAGFKCLCQFDHRRDFTQVWIPPTGWRPYMYNMGLDDLGPRAVEAVGKLLLSTGINPSDEEMRRWRAISDGKYEEPLLEPSEDEEDEEELFEDPDRSEWEFLLSGIETPPTATD
ncbi:hypothetical protein Daus18300_001449 [Diaporthe australafricana]|uniref:F-box domain-containing protein n=1 Tax=Diaporthe australafricana TaxID=127596 RepID=A0ABR3XVR0_9PEZI